MSTLSDIECQRARHAVDRAARNIAGEIDKILATVAPLETFALTVSYEWLLLALTDVLLERVVDKMVQPGDATIRLSNALHDYRDS